MLNDLALALLNASRNETSLGHEFKDVLFHHTLASLRKATNGWPLFERAFGICSMPTMFPVQQNWFLIKSDLIHSYSLHSSPSVLDVSSIYEMLYIFLSCFILTFYENNHYLQASQLGRYLPNWNKAIYLLI